MRRGLLREGLERHLGKHLKDEKKGDVLVKIRTHPWEEHPRGKHTHRLWAAGIT